MLNISRKKAHTPVLSVQVVLSVLIFGWLLVGCSDVQMLPSTNNDTQSPTMTSTLDPTFTPPTIQAAPSGSAAGTAISTSAKFASWKDMFAVASEAANNVESGSVLIRSSAAFIENCTFGKEKPALITFDFTSASGKSIRIYIEDMDPPKIANTIPDSGRNEPPSPEMLKTIAANADNVQVGPREVCQRLQPDILPYWSEGTALSVVLDTREPPEELTGRRLTAGWFASYSVKGGPYLQFYIASDTGEIVWRTKDNLDGTIVPLTPPPPKP